jgi:hypothetical protein
MAVKFNECLETCIGKLHDLKRRIKADHEQQLEELKLSAEARVSAAHVPVSCPPQIHSIQAWFLFDG